MGQAKSKFGELGIREFGIAICQGKLIQWLTGNSRNEETDRIYIEWLNEMPDGKLESEARFTIWTCLTTLHGPYAYEV